MICFFLENPLARGFDLRDGGVGIRVPEVIAGDDYQIVRA